MKIRVNLQIFLFAFIFILTKQIQIYGCVMFFALIHELGHMITGILIKLRVKTFEVMPFGISIMFETYDYIKLVEKKKIIIAIAGPVVNFIIAIIFSIIDSKANQLIIYSNLLIGFFNLIPIYPLDGGRILKSLIKLKYEEKYADKITNTVSNIILILITALASILILYIKNISVLFVIIYLWIMRINENKKILIKKRVYKVLSKKDKSIDI